MVSTPRLAALALLLLLLVACNSAAPDSTTVQTTPEASATAASTEPEAGATLTDTAALTDTAQPATEAPTLGEDAVTTDSGLRYEDTQVGDGEAATRGALVEVHYTGYLEDGTIFDTSTSSGQPLRFALGAGRVIRGWDEGIEGMKVGGKRLLVIPPDLAYGAEGSGPIPPDSTLIFDVELVSVEEQPEPAAVDDYQTTDSGLEYAVLQEGEGEAARLNDIVTFNYSAWLEDGVLYDSSAQAGNPARLPLGQSGLPGLDEGIAGMKVGEKRQLRIPPELAYGAEGAGEVVPPNATVIFEVELIELLASPQLSLLDEGEYTETDNGLRYAILEKGEGDAVEEGDIVTVHYSGWLEDGTLFDSSVPREEPFTFTQGQERLTQGVDEGIVGMQVGERRQLRVPAALAFGAEGAGDVIPPDAPIVFEIELLERKEGPKLALADEFQTTESGLEYAILEEGDGEAAEVGDSVLVHYSGWLEDGTLFDSSETSGQPFPFTIGRGDVIAGWDEGVVGMQVGERRQLRIPAELAYGEEGIPGTIPPNSTLVFNVELVEIQPSQE